MQLDWVALAALRFALLLPAIVFHEVAHGWAALSLGDTTARDQGRLSLNPIRHIDLFGTIILPLLLVATAGVGFGYAKPVPVNPYRFKDYRKGMVITGLAGPAANVILAAVAGLAYRSLALVGLGESIPGLLLLIFGRMNLMLLFFNLIPLPPLDGSRVLPLVLSDRALAAYHQWERYGFLILFAVMWFSPQLLGFDIFSAYFSVTVDPLMRVFAGV